MNSNEMLVGESNYFVKDGNLYRIRRDKITKLDLEKVKRDNPWLENRIVNDSLILFHGEKIIENISLYGSKNGYKDYDYTVYLYKAWGQRVEEKLNINTDGRSKIALEGKRIGKDIQVKSDAYEDLFGNRYILDTDENILTIEFGKEQLRKKLEILEYRNGDYGIWLDEEAPYYYNGEKIVNKNNGKEKTMEEIRELGFVENRFLFDEDRLSDEYLWIHKDEIILMDEEDRIREENRVEEERNRVANEPDENQRENSSGENLGSRSQNSVGSEGVEGSNQDDEEERNNLEPLNLSPLNLQDLQVTSPTGGGSPIVVQGAMCMCTGGTAPGTLSVLSNQIVKVDNMLAATIQDGTLANFTPFGGCLPLANVYGVPPCSLALTGQWICTDGGFFINGTPVLTVSGKLPCAIGGMVTIVQPGQGKHLTKK